MKGGSDPAHGESATGSRRQHGFTLVESMVSLLIGLVIMLGASQLFIASQRSFEQVRDLGLRQGTLNYAVDVLSRGVRRAEHIDWEEGALVLAFAGLIEPGPCEDGQTTEGKRYSLKKTTAKGNDWSLAVAVTCAGEAALPAVPLVDGFIEEGLYADAPASGAPGLWELTLRLAPIGENVDPERITFRVMSRACALVAEAC